MLGESLLENSTDVVNGFTGNAWYFGTLGRIARDEQQKGSFMCWSFKYRSEKAHWTWRMSQADKT